jgi:shikimate dehydrogenase
MTDKYAVIGNPIAHSKSPQIHKMFAEQTGQDISYEAILAPLDGFAATVERLRKEGFKGCNVTVPFKLEAFSIATELSMLAQEAQAVNTFKFVNDTIRGDNTDGIGLIKDITQNLKYEITGQRVLLMGAGGAAIGVFHPLYDKNPRVVRIANRTEDKAQKIKERSEERRPKYAAPKFVTQVSSGSYADLLSAARSVSDNSDSSVQKFDLVINATSTGLSNEMPQLSPDIFAPGALAYDLMYGRETPFMKFAREHGAAVVADGLGMLVEQAAESFFIWRGVRPETAPVIAALRKQQ